MSIQLNREQVVSWLPDRPEDSHKGTFGRVLIAAGSVGFTGAPLLASRSAVRGGTGLVFLGVPKSVWPIAAAGSLEAMPFPLPEDGAGRLSPEALSPLLERAEGCDAMLIGPGLGQSEGIDELVCALLSRVHIPVILDADGINAMSRHIDILSRPHPPLILTPHDGEYARLTGHFPGTDRTEEARRFAADHSCVLVLKGHRTRIAAPDGTVYENTTGNNGMAKGGSGDALAGLMLSLLGQGMEPLHAAAAAVWIHGRAGDYAAAEKGCRGMTPGDLIDLLPRVWRDDFPD